MQDVLYIENVEQAVVLLKPVRIDILQRLDEPRTCPELADYFGESAQKIYYHVKALEKAGLVQKVEEVRVRGVVEGHYQAVARSYWLAPQLVGKIGGQRMTNDQVSLRVLLDIAEDVHKDIGTLGTQAEHGKSIPSLSLSSQIQLPDGKRRAQFLAELQTLVTDLARKYSIPQDDLAVTDSAGFRLVVMCYPHKTDHEYI